MFNYLNFCQQVKQSRIVLEPGYIVTEMLCLYDKLMSGATQNFTFVSSALIMAKTILSSLSTEIFFGAQAIAVM